MRRYRIREINANTKHNKYFYPEVSEALWVCDILTWFDFECIGGKSAWKSGGWFRTLEDAKVYVSTLVAWDQALVEQKLKIEPKEAIHPYP